MFELPREPKFHDYESPITRIYKDMETQIVKDGENQIFQAIQKCDIVVDKQELIKALQYDRGQYEKGYNDGLKAGYEKAKAELLAKITDSLGNDV